jgi:hypothetical protein
MRPPCRRKSTLCEECVPWAEMLSAKPASQASQASKPASQASQGSQPSQPPPSPFSLSFFLSFCLSFFLALSFCVGALHGTQMAQSRLHDRAIHKCLVFLTTTPRSMTTIHDHEGPPICVFNVQAQQCSLHTDSSPSPGDLISPMSNLFVATENVLLVCLVFPDTLGFVCSMSGKYFAFLDTFGVPVFVK